MSNLNQIVIQLVLDAQQYAAGAQQALGVTQNLAKGAQGAFAGIPNVTQQAAQSYQKFFTQTAQGSAGLNQALAALGTGSQGFFSKFISSAGEAITMSARFAALYIVVSGLKNIVASGIDEFVNLDKNLRNIQSITLEDDAAIGRLRQTLIDTVLSGNSFGRSASELADGMYELVSAGYTSAQSVGLVKVAAEGASAGLSDTTTSSKLLLSILQAYHLPVTEAKNVMDQLFTIVDLGVLHFDDLGHTMGLVVPTAAALKIPLSEVGAAIELLTRQGQQPSRVMTNLNSVMTALLKPTPALSLEMNKLGFESGEAAVKALGFAEVVRRLAVDAEGSDTQLTKWFGNVRAIRAILPLTASEGKDFTQMLADNNAELAKGDRTDKAFAEQQKALAFQWTQLTAKLRAFIDEITTNATPHVIGFLGMLNDFLPTFVGIIKGFTGSTVAMTLLKDAVLVFIALQFASHISGIVGMLTLARAKVVDFALSLYGIAIAHPWLIALVVAFTALDVALQHFGGQTAAAKALADIDVQAQAFIADAEKIDTEVANGTMSKFAGDIAKVQSAFEHTNAAASDFAEGVSHLGVNLDTALMAGKAALSNPISFFTGGGADFVGDFKKKFADMNKDVMNGLGTNLTALREYRDSLTSAELSADKSFSGEKLKLYTYGLETANQAVSIHIHELEDVTAKHQAINVAAGETTDAITESNSRLETMLGHLKAMAANYKVFSDAVKEVASVVSAQSIQDEMQVDTLQRQVDVAKIAATTEKERHDAAIKGMEREKDAFNDQKSAVQDQLTALEERRTAFEENYKANKKTTDSLKEQAALLKDQIDNAVTPQNPFNIPIDRLNAVANLNAAQKKQLETLEKQSHQWEAQQKLQKDIAEQAKVRNDLPQLKEKYKLLQDQIKTQDTFQKQNDDNFAAQDNAMKAQETPIKNQLKAMESQSKLLDHRISAARDAVQPEQDILKSLENQLASAQNQKKEHEETIKLLAEKQTLLIVNDMTAQGLLPTFNEQKALLEAITALYLKQPEKIQAIADKYGITNDRLTTLLGKQSDFNTKTITPKVDDFAVGSLERHLSGIDSMVIEPKVDDHQVVALDKKLDEIAIKAAKNTTDFVRSALSNVYRTLSLISNTGGADIDRQAPVGSLRSELIGDHDDGGFTSRPQLSWLSKDGRPEVVLPLSRPDRAMQLLSSVASRFMPWQSARPNLSGAHGSGSMQVANNQRSMYNYGTIVLDQHTESRKDDEAMLLQRMVS